MKSPFRVASFSVAAVFSLATALPAAAQVAGGAREEQARVSAAAMRQIQALVPVSYTHLTLPTILRV